MSRRKHLSLVQDCRGCGGQGDRIRYLGARPELETCPRCGGSMIEPADAPPIRTTLSPPSAA